MRNILILCCAFLLSFCVAIPFIGNESPNIETPHPSVGSLQDMNSNAYDGQDKRATLHKAKDCFFSTNAQDDAENNGKLGQRTHKLTSHCMNTGPKRRILSRKHSGSVHKGHKMHAARTSSKSAVVDANDPHWSHHADYRRSPMFDLLKGIERPRLTSTSTGGPHMEPTQAPSTSSHHTEKMDEKPTNPQGSDGNRPDGWEAYKDWKQ